MACLQTDNLTRFTRRFSTRRDERRVMVEPESIYILGAGSIGMSLAVHLVNNGRSVTAVRTSTDDMDSQVVEVTIQGSDGKTSQTPVEMVSLARLNRLAGVIVVTAKSYVNALIASRLREMEILAPIVIMQNGLSVENPYLTLEDTRIYRCVLYTTGQKIGENHYTFFPITASPLGIVRGDEKELERLVSLLNTAEFPFISHSHIQQEIWKKATINSVFNTICPLLEIDNGIFVREERTAQLAREIVDECIAVMESIGVRLSAEEVIQQIFAISKRSTGQLISTLQDINNGRETEIDSLNPEIARIGEKAAPQIKVSTTRVLGEMVKIKAMLRKNQPGPG
jgi:2-dehydropantoate 2-reductase